MTDGYLVIDTMTEDELFYYVLGCRNFLSFLEGWDWTEESWSNDRVWIDERDLE